MTSQLAPCCRNRAISSRSRPLAHGTGLPRWERIFWVLAITAISLTIIPVQAQEATPLREMGRQMPGFQTTGRPQYHEAPMITRESVHWMDSPDGRFAADYGWNQADAQYIASQRMLNFDIGGRVSAGYSYNDNLFLADSSSGQQGVGSSDLSLTASLSYGPNSWGLSSFLTYNPMVQWFYDSVVNPNDGEEVNYGFNQSVNWNIAWAGARLRTALNLSYIAMDGANIEVGQWVTQNTVAANFSLGYDYSPKTTLGFNLGTQLMDLSGAFLNQNNYNASLFASYQISPKVRIGPQIGYSYFEVDGGSNSDSIQYNLSATWAATSRFSLTVTGGVEDRNFSGNDEGTLTPIFMVNANYNPFSDGRTSFSMSTYRRYSPSVALANQGFYATGVTANFSRQIGFKTAFTLSGGYEFTDYETMDSATLASRSDQIYFIRSMLTYAINHRFSLSSYYQVTENDSDGFGASSFRRTQYGIMATAAF